MTKVLLVEDDNNLREIYEARLAAEGYDIVTAKDGEEALEVAKQHRPELIISDVMMPRISGFEMLDILRTTNGLNNVKVIMLTALGQAEDKARADHLGADRYLVKSQVTLEDIVKSAEELLNGVEAPTDVAEVTPTAFAPEPAPVAPATPALDHTAPATVYAAVEPTPAVPTVAMPPEFIAQPVIAQPDTPQPTYAQPVTPLPMPTIPLTPEPYVAQPVQPQQIVEPTMPMPEPAPLAFTAPEPTPVSFAPAPAPEPAPVAFATPTPELVTQVPTVTLPDPSPEFTPPVETSPATDISLPQVSEPAPATDISLPQVPAAAPAEATAPDFADIPVIELPDLDVQTESQNVSNDAPVTVRMPTTPSNDVVTDAQTSLDEEAVIEEQIEQFIHTDSVMPQGVTPQPPAETEPADSTPADDSANASIINSAVEQLEGASPTPSEEPEPATQLEPENPETTTEPDQAQTTAPDPVNSNQISGKKMLSPISVDENKADLASLVAQEQINENMARGVTGSAVVADVLSDQSAPTTPPLTINTDAAQPGGVFTPNAEGSAQSNAL